MVSINLKETIQDYYDSNNDQLKLRNISDSIVMYLLDNGLKVQDIDTVLLNLLKRTDRSRFKYYLINKSDKPLKCFMCNTDNDIQMHHLKTIDSHPGLEFDKDNVVFLCSSCHALVHHGGSQASNIKSSILKKKVKSVFNRLLNSKLQKQSQKEF